MLRAVDGSAGKATGLNMRRTTIWLPRAFGNEAYVDGRKH